MTTDNERRKVAARLREYASWDEDGELVGCTEFGEAVLNLLSCGDTERECFNALADLIEPSCDRDALLGVLDEMDVTIRYAGPDVERDCIESWAGRIREALGVEQ